MKSAIDRVGLVCFVLLIGDGTLFALGGGLHIRVLIDIAIIVLGVVLQIMLVFLYNLAPDNRHMFASERQYKFARLFNRVMFYGLIGVILMEQCYSLVHIVRIFRS